MDTPDIRRRILSLPGIHALNPMQTAMLACSAKAAILIAPTGSGKTIAFITRILRILRPPLPREHIQALIIAPSRELVLQTAEVARRLAAGWKTVACYGGHSMREETRSLEAGASIIVATPGRLLDHLQRATLTSLPPAAIVIDEYDKALELGFHDEMSRIFHRMAQPRSVTLTSATRFDAIPSFIGSDTPEIIDYSSDDDKTSPRNRMDIVEVKSPATDKLQTLADLLRSLPQGKAIVFANHRESAERIYGYCRRNHLPVTLYHGGMDQQQRTTAIDLLHNGSAPILIATDLAARGLDIDSLNHIIHYHLPPDEPSWIHRNGRTARQQAEGTVYAITSDHDSLPPFISFDRPYNPSPKAGSGISATTATLRFDAGRKEKISRADILGYLTACTPLESSDIGLILLHDHYALAAVAPQKAIEAVKASAGARIKKKRVRVELFRDFGPASRTPVAATATKPAKRHI